MLSLKAQNNEIATKVAKLDHDYATPPPPGERFYLEYARMCYAVLCDVVWCCVVLNLITD